MEIRTKFLHYKNYKNHTLATVGKQSGARAERHLEIMVRSLEAIKTQKWVIIISPIQAHI